MTNEEIEKRFKFDLEMGVFFSSTRPGNYFDVENDYNAKITLTILLYKSGYRNGHTYQNITSLEEQIWKIRNDIEIKAVSINGVTKKYGFLVTDAFRTYQKVYNEEVKVIKPPDYIKEYVL